MIADPQVQLRLLDLQSVDTTLSQLAHRRRSLPQLAAIADCDARGSEARTALTEAETAVADHAAEQRRLEADVDTVRQRADKDQARMTSAGVPAKEITGLQHEVASLARRQSILEDELLELMERAETSETEVGGLKQTVADIDSERALAVQARDVAFAEIDEAIATQNFDRTDLVAGLPADLLALYDRVRVASGGVGAAMVRQRRCEGCRIELAGNELSVVRNAKPEDVLRCENCRRILVRSAESGL